MSTQLPLSTLASSGEQAHASAQRGGGLTAYQASQAAAQYAVTTAAPVAGQQQVTREKRKKSPDMGELETLWFIAELRKSFHADPVTPNVTRWKQLAEKHASIAEERMWPARAWTVMRNKYQNLCAKLRVQDVKRSEWSPVLQAFHEMLDSTRRLQPRKRTRAEFEQDRAVPVPVARRSSSVVPSSNSASVAADLNVAATSPHHHHHHHRSSTSNEHEHGHSGVEPVLKQHRALHGESMMQMLTPGMAMLPSDTLVPSTQDQALQRLTSAVIQSAIELGNAASVVAQLVAGQSTGAARATGDATASSNDSAATTAAAAAAAAGRGSLTVPENPASQQRQGRANSDEDDNNGDVDDHDDDPDEQQQQQEEEEEEEEEGGQHAANPATIPVSPRALEALRSIADSLSILITRLSPQSQ